MWHTYQTFPFGSGGIHSSAAFWKSTATCKRGCWQARQKRLRQFAQRWSLVKEMTSWNKLAQRNMSLFIDQVDHQFTLEKFKFAIKRCVCVWAIRESKVGGACTSYLLQSVIPERVEVFSITCVTQRAPNQPQWGDDHTIRSSRKSQHSQDHWQQHLKGKRPSTSHAQKYGVTWKAYTE